MNNFKKLLVFVLFIIMPTGILYCTMRFYPHYFPDTHLQLITTTILLATLLAITLYTWKTWQLKDLTSEQISLNIRPVVTLYKKNNLLKLKNIGNGIAQNIAIEEMYISTKHLTGKPKDAGNLRINCYINSACLSHDAEEELYYKITHNEESILDSFVLEYYVREFVNKINAIPELKVVIHYEDIRKNVHTTVMSNKDSLLKAIKI